MPRQFLKAFLSAYLWVKELDPLLRELGIRTDVDVEGPRLPSAGGGYRSWLQEQFHTGGEVSQPRGTFGDGLSTRAYCIACHHVAGFEFCLVPAERKRLVREFLRSGRKVPGLGTVTREELGRWAELDG